MVKGALLQKHPGHLPHQDDPILLSSIWVELEEIPDIDELENNELLVDDI